MNQHAQHLLCYANSYKQLDLFITILIILLLVVVVVLLLFIYLQDIYTHSFNLFNLTSLNILYNHLFTAVLVVVFIPKAKHPWCLCLMQHYPQQWPGKELSLNLSLLRSSNFLTSALHNIMNYSVDHCVFFSALVDLWLKPRAQNKWKKNMINFSMHVQCVCLSEVEKTWLPSLCMFDVFLRAETVELRLARHWIRFRYMT